MKKTTRDRFVLPILLPVGILAVGAAVLYGFSRILLAISHDAATAELRLHTGTQFDPELVMLFCDL